MGKRGPKPLPTEELERRGSWRARRRQLDEAAAARKPARPRVVTPAREPLPVDDDVAGWRTILCALPKYDPFVLAGDCRFDPARARKVIDFFETKLVFVEGKKAGQHVRLELWQKAWLCNLFGWTRPNGRRRFAKTLLYIPKKNSKSTLSAGVALYLFLEDGEEGAQVFTAATKLGQARIVWDAAIHMVRRSPELSPLLGTTLQVYGGGGPNQKGALVKEGEPGKFAPITGDAESEDGLNPHGIIFDELHRQEDTKLIDVLRESTTGRTEPVTVNITTADEDRESPCNDEYAYAKSVRDNPGDPERPGFDRYYLPAIWEAEKEDDWRAESTWFKANPGLGTIKSIDVMRDLLAEALAKPTSRISFQRYHLNLRTQSTTSLIPMEHWDRCGEPFDPKMLLGRVCYPAIDLAETSDMVGLVLYFPEGHYVLPFYWVPEAAVLDRDRRNDPLYKRWAEAGKLTVTNGNMTDYELLYAKVDELSRVYSFSQSQIAIDRAMAGEAIVRLGRMGFDVVPYGQGWISMSEPTKKLLWLCGNGLLRHGGHQVLRWNAQNARAKIDEKKNITIVKPRGPAKIDGLVCLVMGIGRSISTPAPAAPGVFFASSGEEEDVEEEDDEDLEDDVDDDQDEHEIE